MGTTSNNDNTLNITNIIWIDPNIDNKENKYYTKELNKIENAKINCLKNVEDSLKLIKKIKFQ